MEEIIARLNRIENALTQALESEDFALAESLNQERRELISHLKTLMLTGSAPALPPEPEEAEENRTAARQELIATLRGAEA